MAENNIVRAALVIIGNEILSGRTLDKNTQHIAEKVGEKGIRLSEVRIVPDVMEKVVEAVNALRGEYDYVFTTGGIGPTHDDITVDCIAAAFGVPVEVHAEAYARLLKHYGEAEFTEARQRMARGPAGAALIDNPVSTAPGFVIGNVYVMAGVPRIMQAMLENVLINLTGGAQMVSVTLTCSMPESAVSGALGDVQAQFADVDIGSYPFFHSGNVGVSVVLRGTDEARLDEAAAAVEAAVRDLGGDVKRV
jgi:molybdenum cofactor synthesis domain-containing protein